MGPDLGALRGDLAGIDTNSHCKTTYISNISNISNIFPYIAYFKEFPITKTLQKSSLPFIPIGGVFQKLKT